MRMLDLVILEHCFKWKQCVNIRKIEQMAFRYSQIGGRKYRTESKDDRNCNPKKIAIEELLFNQMQENLGKSIVDYVQSTRGTLEHAGPLKTRKIVLAVQKNLNKFMKGSYNDKIRLASDFYSSIKSLDRENYNQNQHQIFSKKLLYKQLRKQNCSTKANQQQGHLRKTLAAISRKQYRMQPHMNIVLKDRRDQCYSARHHREKMSAGFNVIMNR